MSGHNLFLDTNIILYLLNGDETLAELLYMKQLYISVITEIELLGFNGIKPEDEKIIKEFILQCKVININEKIKDETIRLRKKYHTKIPDCLIIATALYLDLPLISSDSGFKKVAGLFLIQYEK